MSVQPFIPKQDDRIPDAYAMTIHFHDGKRVEFETASHSIRDGFLDFVTKDDLWNLIPLTSIQRIEFDKSFSKLVAIKAERSTKKNA